jgi:hypothetical protein
MADKKITVQVEVETNVEPSIASIKQLKKELRELAVTDPKFAEKQQQINDFEDALKSDKAGMRDKNKARQVLSLLQNPNNFQKYPENLSESPKRPNIIMNPPVTYDLRQNV